MENRADKQSQIECESYLAARNKSADIEKAFLKYIEELDKPWVWQLVALETKENKVAAVIRKKEDLRFGHAEVEMVCGAVAKDFTTALTQVEEMLNDVRGPDGSANLKYDEVTDQFARDAVSKQGQRIKTWPKGI